MKKRLGIKVASIGLSSVMAIGCGVTIKVDKKPRNVDLSALENIEALNLTSSDDFLKHMDDLKVVAVDLLMQQLTKKDYRALVRSSIRDYRTHLIASAKKSYNYDDAFYADVSQDCREHGLSFDLDKSQDTLGIILKTAVLAKISEHGAGNINPSLSKELAAIGQLILAELGIEIDGEVDVAKVDDNTQTTGSFKLKLLEIAGEKIDDETRKRDQVESISMTFTRDLGAEYAGTFAAAIEVTEYVDDTTTKTYNGDMHVMRKDVDGKFLHSIRFDLGEAGMDPTYSRELVFEQVDDAKHQLKVTDTSKPGTDASQSVTTIVDAQAGTQCKFEINIDDKLQETGDEGGFVDGAEDSSDADSDGDSDMSEDGADDETGGTSDDSADDGSEEEPSDSDDGSDEADDDKEPVKTTSKPLDDDDDDVGPGKGQNPGQTPGQTPGQAPIQG